MTLGAAAVADLLRRYDVRPRRSLGQHFVVDPNTVERVVRCAGVSPGGRVVEIGAGCGALTVGLADAGASVLALEIDDRLLGALEEVTAGRDVEVRHADATDLSAWAPRLEAGTPPGGAWKLVANLPYNVATPLLLDVLDRLPQITEMVVMVQREVAERLAAPPGHAAYGLPSLKVACWARASVLGSVPPTVFWPRPRVSSALLGVRRCPEPAAGNVEELVGLARRAFGQRRKMLRSSLREVVGQAAFEAARVDPTARPGELTVGDWSRLAATVGSGAAESSGVGL
ncbi:MAG: 16S rRNA (adenine(1518)-N(6)/adenine(1519)-N(6))-dimethyltransferase RsmA [bacterium]|nr:16S rRNA (adenine(1518)-N(6)/adenine(1519)-N(6))-dimethyltransferase RsmA [bacterium]